MVLDTNANDNIAEKTGDNGMEMIGKTGAANPSNIGGPKIDGPNTIEFTGPNPPSQVVKINNGDNPTPGWDIQGTVPLWLKFDPQVGKFDDQGEAKINVSVIPGELKGKIGRAEVTFRWNPLGSPSSNNVLTVKFTP